MDRQTVLHLNSYYIDNHLYSHLYTKLDPFVTQKVYIPIKLNRSPHNEVELDNTQLVFDKCIKASDKYFYFLKMRNLYKRLLANRLHEDVSLAHAHNLFTDGVLACRLKKEFGIPYMVAVRHTDIRLQYKYMLHRRFYANEVLKEAETIVFVSPAYKDRLFSMLPAALADSLSERTRVIPNGVQDTWINNPYPGRELSEKKQIRILYVGQIKKLKNVVSLVQAVEKLNAGNSEPEFVLDVIGGPHEAEPDYFQEFSSLVDKHSWLTYQGKITQSNELMAEYRKADIFAMPSTLELFGLVYIEALSQGLPIVYPAGEGISRFFEESTVGAAIDPHSVESIANGIKRIRSSSYVDLHKAVEPFDWNVITNVYLDLYKRHEPA